MGKPASQNSSEKCVISSSNDSAISVFLIHIHVASSVLLPFLLLNVIAMWGLLASTPFHIFSFFFILRHLSLQSTCHQQPSVCSCSCTSASALRRRTKEERDSSLLHSDYTQHTHTHRGAILQHNRALLNIFPLPLPFAVHLHTFKNRLLLNTECTE
jgi:hypothetical protein